jgi:hypothetical protein
MPPRRGLGAALVIVACFDLLFALACGCTSFSSHGIVASAASLAELPREEGLERSQGMMVAMRDWVEKSSSGQQRKDYEALLAVLEKHEFHKDLYEAFTSSRSAGVRSRLVTLGLIGLLLHAALLVAGIMLFVRARIARTFGMLVAVGLLVVNILLAVAYREWLTDVNDHLAPALHAILQEERSSEHSLAEFERMMEVLPTVLVGTVGVLTCLWPAISLLVLAVSRGIKRDLGLDAHPTVP